MKIEEKKKQTNNNYVESTSLSLYIIHVHTHRHASPVQQWVFCIFRSRRDAAVLIFLVDYDDYDNEIYWYTESNWIRKSISRTFGASRARYGLNRETICDIIYIYMYILVIYDDNIHIYIYFRVVLVHHEFFSFA